MNGERRACSASRLCGAERKGIASGVVPRQMIAVALRQLELVTTQGQDMLRFVVMTPDRSMQNKRHEESENRPDKGFRERFPATVPLAAGAPAGTRPLRRFVSRKKK